MYPIYKKQYTKHNRYAKENNQIIKLIFILFLLIKYITVFLEVQKKHTAKFHLYYFFTKILSFYS